jgi:hypothetical protein
VKVFCLLALLAPMKFLSKKNYTLDIDYIVDRVSHVMGAGLGLPSNIPRRLTESPPPPLF